MTCDGLIKSLGTIKGLECRYNGDDEVLEAIQQPWTSCQLICVEGRAVDFSAKAFMQKAGGHVARAVPK